jgi:hypothetical protein
MNPVVYSGDIIIFPEDIKYNFSQLGKGQMFVDPTGSTYEVTKLHLGNILVSEAVKESKLLGAGREKVGEATKTISALKKENKKLTKQLEECQSGK